jgi:hypothetical protein
MAQIKFDYLVEAMHYSPTGELEKIRLYERRGPSFSDRIIINRDELIHYLVAGKKVAAGNRVSLMASTFNQTGEIQISGSKEDPVLVMGGEIASKDSLSGIPVY